MNPSIFREYDIRGIVGTDLLLEEARFLGQAIGLYLLHEMGDTPRMLLGRDGRLHSPQLAEELTKGLCDVGISVLDVGICPSPALYFATFHHEIAHGLMVTASHNPAEYNGIKLWGVSGKRLQELASIFFQRMTAHNPLPHTKRGTITCSPIVPAYVAYLVQQFPDLQGSSVAAAIDCANGSACSVIPYLVERMGWQHVKLLFATMDGSFPNHEPDPTEASNAIALQAAVLNHNLAYGIGLDGDCDRMAPVTQSGQLVAGDKLLALFGADILTQQPVSIVMDIKGSSQVVNFLEQRGARVVVSPSGHTIIKTMMKQHQAVLGGELSCHFFFKDDYFGYDDGIYAMLRLMRLLARQQTTLDALLAQLPPTVTSPEFRLHCNKAPEAVKALTTWLSQETSAHLITIDGVKAEFASGWGLARSSNTQPVLCLRFEADTPEHLIQIKQLFSYALQDFIDTQKLLSDTTDLMLPLVKHELEQRLPS